VTQKVLLIVAAALGSAAAAIGSAKAAAPAYCALYAREFAVDSVQPGAAAGMLQSVQDQAYYRCLNQDEDPPLPKASAYFGTGIAATVAFPGRTAPGVPAAAPKPASAAAAPSTEVPAAAPRVVVTARASAAGYRGSGMTPWTQEWMDWCARNFPNSWDDKSGTVLHYGSGSRELCK
jgi:hypothetical protein